MATENFLLVVAGWDVELEYCPLYLISLLGQRKEHSQKTRSIPEHGMPEPVFTRSCGLPQRTALTKTATKPANTIIGTTALDGLSCLSTVSWSVLHSSPEE